MELTVNENGSHLIPPSPSSVSLMIGADQSQLRNDTVDLQQSIPFTLSFNNLSYNVKVPRKYNLFRPGDTVLCKMTTRTILNDVSGDARDGEILAVLGASGSGKSTLLDALANRINKSSLKGTIALNGEVMESRTLKMISAYVMQEDLLFPMLTVEETLMFAAEFRLPRSLPKPKRVARVQALIDQLGLRSAANTVIGDEGHRGVSGGERRRVSIGVDIIHDPVILFLDEPTSGLDSTSAFMVVNVLKRIARSGSIVIMTVHQPSYRILRLLDRLLFLSGGRAVYSGPPADLPPFFSGFGCPIPESENWVEFGLDLVRELEASPDGTKGLVQYNKTWQEKNPRVEEGKKNDLNLKEAIRASISQGKLVTEASDSDLGVGSFANPVWREMGVLWRRSTTNSWRMPELVGVRFAVVLLSGFLLGTIFWRLDDSPKGVGERLGFFGFALSTTFYTSADALPVFVQERYIFLRETAYNSYRRSSYVLTYALLALPSLVFLSLGFAAMTFWTVGLAGGISGFLYYFLIILASFYSGNSFVTFVSGIVPHVMLGYVVVIATLAYHILFSGFFISSDRIPPYWIWFNYLSLVKYPYEGILQNEFQYPTKCFVRGVQIFDNTALGGLPDTTKLTLLESMSDVLGGDVDGSMCWTTGVQVLHEQGATHLNKWNCFLVTVAWAIFFRVCFYFSLLLGNKNKRK